MTSSPVDILVQNLSNLSLKETMTTIQNVKAFADFLPTFQGNPIHLESFTNECDTFYNTFGKTTDTTINHFAFTILKSKLRDDAANYIMCRPDLNTWPLIKKAIRSHFGDRVDRQTLTREFLHMSKNRNENILDFLDRVRQIKSRIDIKISTDSSIPADRKSLVIDQNEANAVDVLLINVDDNLRNILELKETKKLTDAEDIITKHFYNRQRITSIQEEHKTKHPNPQRIMTAKPVNPPFNPFNTPRLNYFNTNSFPKPTSFQQQPNYSINRQSYFPSQPINIQPRPQIDKKYFTNEQVFGKPRNVFASQANFKPTYKPEPMSTTSRISNPNTQLNKSSYKPQPMSVSTRNTFKKPNNFQSQGPRNFISQELTNVENYNQLDTYAPEESHPVFNNYDLQYNHSNSDNYDGNECYYFNHNEDNRNNEASRYDVNYSPYDTNPEINNVSENENFPVVDQQQRNT